MYISRIGTVNERIFPSSGLQSYWRLDEASGTVYDSVGSINGTVNNATMNQTGKNNKSVLINSNNGNINFGDNYMFAYNAAFSFSYWINKSVALTSGGIMFGKYNTSSNLGYENFQNGDGSIWILLRNGGSYIGVGYGSPANNTVPASGFTALGVWYHVVITYNGNVNASGFQIYMNALKGTTYYNYNVGSLTSISTNYNFYIGNRHTGASSCAGGYMDEFGIWNRVLTQDEVTAIYNLGTGIYY